MSNETKFNWVVDFDGTLINIDLGAKFSQWLIDSGSTKKYFGIVRMIGGSANFFFKRFGFGQVIRAWSIGLSESEVKDLIDKFLTDISGKYLINWALIDRLAEDRKSKKILLTGCPEEIVSSFLKKNNLELFDEVIGMRVQRQVFIERHPYGRSKVKFSRQFHPFWAIGDSWTDRHLLRKAAHAVIVPRDKRLEKMASQFGWEVSPFKETRDD